MGQFLTNIGKVETAGAASIGAVSLLSGTGLIGTMNTLAIGGGSTVSIVNSAGWLITVANTATTINIANTGGIVLASQSGNWVTQAVQSGNWLVSVANTSNLYNLVNSAGWVVAVSNTGGAYSLLNGTGVIGTANIISQGGYLAAQQSGTWTVTSTTARFTQIALNSAMIGSATVAIYGTASATVVGGTVNITNSGGWTVAISNTSGIRDYSTIETMQMSSSGIPVRPYSAVIECSATNNLIVAASANRIFKVVGYSLMAQAANNARFQSGSNATSFMTGNHFFGGSGGIVMPYNPMGWFSVTAGSPLYLKLASANSVGGVVSYLVM